MKTFLVSPCAVVGFRLSGFRAGSRRARRGQDRQDRSPRSSRRRIFSITGGPQKRSKTGDWLEVEVEFETKAEEIDELTFAYTIMIENKLLDRHGHAHQHPEGPRPLLGDVCLAARPGEADRRQAAHRGAASKTSGSTCPGRARCSTQAAVKTGASPESAARRRAGAEQDRKRRSRRSSSTATRRSRPTR